MSVSSCLFCIIYMREESNVNLIFHMRGVKQYWSPRIFEEVEPKLCQPGGYGLIKPGLLLQTTPSISLSTRWFWWWHKKIRRCGSFAKKCPILLMSPYTDKYFSQVRSTIRKVTLIKMCLQKRWNWRGNFGEIATNIDRLTFTPCCTLGFGIFSA